MWGAVRKLFGGYSMPSMLGEWLHRMMHWLSSAVGSNACKSGSLYGMTALTSSG